MSHKIRPLKEFLVRPALPPELSRLPALGLNLLWSWQPAVRAAFRRLDPAAWRAANHNPVVLLGQLPQETLERAARDQRYLAAYKRACETHDSYMASAPAAGSPPVAYFSMEYGLIDCMPIYSGGLGVLSADHLKAASDLSVPLTGIGLLYQRGYLRQTLDAGGWQQEHTPINDFYSLPITPVEREGGGEMLVDVLVGSTRVFLKIWRIDVGRVKLYLLDTNIPQNPDPVHRDITDQLYGGGQRNRIAQEIVLGIGGLRVLRELRLDPAAYHMNEGHSAFLAIERIRLLMAEQGLSFEEALQASHVNTLFTTHTPVPAGIDLFDAGLMHEFFHQYCAEGGIGFDQFLGLGRRNPDDLQEPFSMAIMAIKTSAYRNAVSKLHRVVSQQMWESLWPGLPAWEAPIGSVTNGVHLPTWVNSDLAGVYDQYLEPDWRDRPPDPKVWNHIGDIPDTELWEAHRRRKRRLINFIRERAVARAQARNASAGEIHRLSEVLDPEALTIGFARRFATYKRAGLIFRNLDRLKQILNHPARPVQLVIAGKAHPQDLPGRTLIRELVQYSLDPELSRRVVFVEDYGIQVARELVGGVDLWLNTPRRGEEACGTSGMKAGMNGVLNLSILDGWFDEADQDSGGWAIGDRSTYSPDSDDAHAASIYSLLEEEIAPLYYDDREQGAPAEWMRRMKQSLRYVSESFNSQRMVGEYRDGFYEPAARAHRSVVESGYRAARERVAWSRQVAGTWPQVRFVTCELGSDAVSNAVSTGSPVPLRAEIDLAGLRPHDVRVEALVGRVGPEGDLEDVQVLVLEPHKTPDPGRAVVFSRDVVPHASGRLGFSVRITPNHADDPLTRPVNELLKWAE